MTLSTAERFAARLLIADGPSVAIGALEHLLREAGYSDVLTCSDVADIGVIQRAHPCDLVLLDVRTSVPRAFDVLASLREQTADEMPAVVAICPEAGDGPRALRAGAADFVTLPFDTLEVTTRVRNQLEVRFLQRRVRAADRVIAEEVARRTAELRQSEDRYRRFAELAADWFWEQDENGAFTKVSGPVLELLGFRAAEAKDGEIALPTEQWNAEQRKTLQALIEARKPFINFVFNRADANGTRQQFHVSGEPVFDTACRFTGYRGVGVEIEPN
jgi:PAS domain S-box-containing protein